MTPLKPLLSPKILPALLSSVGLMLLSAGCNQPDASLSPPKRIQLVCKAADAPQAAGLIFILDTGRKEATWINASQPLKGILSTSDVEYRLSLPGDNRTHASEAVVNRYDGAMTREFGKAPSCKRAAHGRVIFGNP